MDQTHGQKCRIIEVLAWRVTLLHILYHSRASTLVTMAHLRFLPLFGVGLGLGTGWGLVTREHDVWIFAFTSTLNHITGVAISFIIHHLLHLFCLTFGVEPVVGKMVFTRVTHRGSLLVNDSLRANISL